LEKQIKCPNDGTPLVEGTQIGGGMTFAYISGPAAGGGQKSLWLYTRICPECGLVQTYIKEPEVFREQW
jgi:hypothetical protein